MYTPKQIQLLFVTSYNQKITLEFYNQSRFSELGSSRYGHLGLTKLLGLSLVTTN